MHRIFQKIKKQYFVLFAMMVVVCGGSFLCLSFNAADKNNLITAEADTGYAGSQSCINCHKDIYTSNIKTAHYLTSAKANAKTIKGSFDADKNIFPYNKFMNVVMEKKGNNFFQTAFAGNTAYQSEPFDIVIGSARKGQTYLYWQNNKLFQLPVSYYTPLNSWCISPGFSNGFIYFDRAIHARCMECHATYAKAEDQEDSLTVFDKNSIIFGVDCERCHGPAEQHVLYQTNHPKDTIGKFIINPALLTRAQQLDACALCHSGFRKAIKPAFSFTVGDKLEDYSIPDYNTDSSSWLDVHGNQYGLLTASKCFKMSNMNCSSCHNVHKEEINEPELFSSRCINCHNEASHNFCTLTSLPAATLMKDCIDCHMPSLPSKKIFLEMADAKQNTSDFVRTHRIAIYPEQTKNFIAHLHSGK